MGQFLSLNYGRVIKINSKSFINASIGLGATFFVQEYDNPNSQENTGAAFPHQLTINFGKNKSFFEVGIGGVFWKEYIDEKEDKIPNNTYFSTIILGYRTYFFKRLLFRAQLTPIIMLKEGEYDPRDFPESSYIGVSLGYAF